MVRMFAVGNEGKQHIFVCSCGFARGRASADSRDPSATTKPCPAADVWRWPRLARLRRCLRLVKRRPRTKHTIRFLPNPFPKSPPPAGGPTWMSTLMGRRQLVCNTAPPCGMIGIRRRRISGSKACGARSRNQVRDDVEASWGDWHGHLGACTHSFMSNAVIPMRAFSDVDHFCSRADRPAPTGYLHLCVVLQSPRRIQATPLPHIANREVCVACHAI